MEAGQLRKLITIEAPTTEQDEDGQDIPAWSTVAGPLWASIRTLSGRQLALSQANTITATSTHLVTIRYREGLQDTWRIVYDQIGAIAFDEMDDGSFANLTDAQFASLVGDIVVKPRIFQIDAVNDADERHRSLAITCTEVTA